MFKKKCPNCDRKIENSHKFCPFCGYDISGRDNEDFGFLGRDDFDNNFESMFNGFPLNKIFQSAMKMMEKTIRETQKQEVNPPKESFSNSMDIQFFVNGKKVFPEQRVKQQIQKPVKIENELAPERIEKISKLPRKEPKTSMKRIGEKVVYELSVPGVEDINDILINQLENSIEVKAISKTKVYSKNLNVNLPILKYSLNRGNLTLELQAR